MAWLANRLIDEFGGGRGQPDIHPTADGLHGRGRGRDAGIAAAAVLLGAADQLAIVLKLDYGSVFARALQRGIGTIVGAVAGAVLLIVVHGLRPLIPFSILAALLPYGRSRNYGLLATFLTPLVVVLIDLLAPAGWLLAEERLIDTLIGCAIVLLVGFALRPMAWYAHLPRQFAETTGDVSRYMEEAARFGLGGGGCGDRRGG